MSMEFLYLSRKDCGVCSAVRPRVIELTARYSQCTFRQIDLDEEPAAAGTYSIFSIPALLVYIDTREVLREARYFDFSAIESRLDRLYHLRFGGTSS